MDTIARLEMFLKILLASLDVQIQTLSLLGQHRFRADLICHLKKLATTLFASLEKLECELLTEIEGKAEHILQTSASLIHALDAAMAAHIPLSQEMPRVARENHKSLTSKLAASEEKRTAEVIARLAPLKQKVAVLLVRIENL